MVPKAVRSLPIASSIIARLTFDDVDQVPDDRRAVVGAAGGARTERASVSGRNAPQVARIRCLYSPHIQGIKSDLFFSA